MAASILQAIGVPLLLALSGVFYLVVAWASARIKAEAEAERTRTDGTVLEQDPEPTGSDQSSNISMVRK